MNAQLTKSKKAADEAQASVAETEAKLSATMTALDDLETEIASADPDDATRLTRLQDKRNTATVRLP